MSTSQDAERTWCYLCQLQSRAAISRATPLCKFFTRKSVPVFGGFENENVSIEIFWNVCVETDLKFVRWVETVLEKITVCFPNPTKRVSGTSCAHSNTAPPGESKLSLSWRVRYYVRVKFVRLSGGQDADRTWCPHPKREGREADWKSAHA